MDDIYIPDESEDDNEDSAGFKKTEIQNEPSGADHPSGVKASPYIKITFERFVSLVAKHSFEDVIERNKDEDIILSTNLLTDLANANSVVPKMKGPILLIGGAVLGAILTYLLFT